MHTCCDGGIESVVCVVASDDVYPPREGSDAIDKRRWTSKNLNTLYVRKIDGDVKAKVSCLGAIQVNAVQ